MDAFKIGMNLIDIGAGRKSITDSLDYTAGIQFISKVGDNVISGEKLFRVFNSDKKKLENETHKLGLIVTAHSPVLEVES